MIKLLNENLLSFRTSKDSETNRETLSVVTSNKIVKNTNTSEGEINRKKSYDIKNKNVQSYTPINREILKINAPDIDNWNEKPMMIKVYDNEKGIPQVEVNVLQDTYQNRANLYVLAFPFNGLLKKIPEDPKYRIYKGVLASSSKPFFYNGKRYRKVLYLVIEPNLNLFDKDHKYHTDSIDITLESFAIFNDSQNKKKTNHDTYTLKIISKSGDYIERFDTEILDNEINMTNEPGTLLWTTFKFLTREEREKQKNEENESNGNVGEKAPRKKLNKGDKPSYIKDGVLITQNKHGIRKEVILNKPRNNNSNYCGYDPSNNYYDKYDKYEDYDDYDNNRNRKKKSPNKRKKNWK